VEHPVRLPSSEPEIPTSELARGTLFVVGAAAVFVGLLIWLVFSFLLRDCGCTVPAT